MPCAQAAVTHPLCTKGRPLPIMCPNHYHAVSTRLSFQAATPVSVSNQTPPPPFFLFIHRQPWLSNPSHHRPPTPRPSILLEYYTSSVIPNSLWRRIHPHQTASLQRTSTVGSLPQEPAAPSLPLQRPALASHTVLWLLSLSRPAAPHRTYRTAPLQLP